MSQDTSGLYKAISTLGGVLAFAISILATPLVFDLTKGPLYRYFLAHWGADLAWILVWVMGGVEAFAIFAASALLLKAGLVWLLTSMAMRRFKE